jgi:hypothetical protein
MHVLRLSVQARALGLAASSGSRSPCALGGGRCVSTKILYTHTDESPMLATYGLLPIVRRFLEPAGIAVDKVDISLPARILAQFPERLTAEQRVPDTLGQLGEVVKGPDATIVKLPNVSASVPQLVRVLKLASAPSPPHPPPPTHTHTLASFSLSLSLLSPAPPHTPRFCTTSTPPHTPFSCPTALCHCRAQEQGV